MQDRKQTISELFRDFVSLKRAMMKEAPSFNVHIPPAQKEVLFILSDNDGMKIKEIAENLGITPGAATQLTEALVQSGLLVRMVDATDRRIVRMHCSGRGKAQTQKLLAARLSLLEQLFKDLSDAEIEAFQNVIKKMNTNMESNQASTNKKDAIHGNS